MESDRLSTTDSDISDSWTFVDNIDIADKLDVDVTNHQDGETNNEVNSTVADDVIIESSDGESVEILDLDAHRLRDGFETDELSIVSEVEFEEIDNFVVKDNDYCDQCLEPISLNGSRIFSRNSTYSDYTNSRVQNIKGPKDDDVTNQDSVQLRVYKHCRNNLINTMLSLAVGVVFASVACIALGHFLGVQDAEQTTEEMMEALKRLQFENNLLQARLSNIEHMDEDSIKSKNRDDMKPHDKQDTQNLPNFSSRKTLLTLQEFINHFYTYHGLKHTTNLANELLTKLQYSHNNNIDKNGEVLNQLDNNLSKTIDKFLLHNQYLTTKFSRFNKLMERLQTFDRRVNQKYCKYFKLHSYQVGIDCDSIHENHVNLFQWYPNVNYQFPKQESYYLNNEDDDVRKTTTVQDVQEGETGTQLDEVVTGHEDSVEDVEQDVEIHPVEIVLHHENNVEDVELQTQHEDNVKYTVDTATKGQFVVKMNDDNVKEDDVEMTEEPTINMKDDDSQQVTSTSSECAEDWDRRVCETCNNDDDEAHVVKHGRSKYYEAQNEPVTKHKSKEKYERGRDIKYKDKKGKAKKHSSRRNEKIERENKESFDKGEKYKKDRLWAHNINIKKIFKKVKATFNKVRKYIGKFNDRITRNWKKEDWNKENKHKDWVKKERFDKYSKHKFYNSKQSKDYNNNKMKNDWKKKENDNNKKSNQKIKQTEKYPKRSYNDNIYNKTMYNNIHVIDENASCGWVSKLGEGRNLIRKLMKTSDWLFDRARGRNQGRNDEFNWQFTRSTGRRLLRDDASWWFRRSDSRNHQRNDFSSDTFIYL